MKQKRFLGIILLLIGGYFLVANLQYQHDLKTPVDPSSTESIPMLISRGSSMERAAEELKKFGLIRRESSFIRYGKSQEKQVLAGRFFLNQAMTIPDLWSVLSDPSKAELVLTIPEGFSSKEIDKRMEEIGLFKEGEFASAVKQWNDFYAYQWLKDEASARRERAGSSEGAAKSAATEREPSSMNNWLEGYLFPDTYFLSPSETPQSLINRLVKNFEKKALAEFGEKNRSLNEAVIIASMLEKEIKTDQDLPIVAGIIWKRLDNDWFLNIDATALYDPTYNTYKNKGLPPGPIGNPGLKTIRAALNPKESPYWYYLTKPETGEVVYAKTNEEQNQNRAKYLR